MATVKNFFEKLEHVKSTLGEEEAAYLFKLATKPKYGSPLTRVEKKQLQHYIKKVYNPEIRSIRAYLESKGIDVIEVA